MEDVGPPLGMTNRAEGTLTLDYGSRGKIVKSGKGRDFPEGRRKGECFPFIGWAENPSPCITEVGVGLVELLAVAPGAGEVAPAWDRRVAEMGGPGKDSFGREAPRSKVGTWADQRH